MGDITKVEVWRKSLKFTAYVYELTKIGDIARDFSFRDQTRRAALSIPSNIAEGLESGFDKLGVRYFYNAKGSIAELRTQLMIASMINYITDEEHKKLSSELEIIAKMLNKLISYRKNFLSTQNK